MFKKQYRLSGKDIQYMLRRGGKIYGKLFVFRVVPQYANRPYVEFSIQIPIKLDKRATMRNLLKRQAKRCFVELVKTQKNIPAYKVFIFVNKQAIESWKDTIATQEKTLIVEKRYEGCKADFTFFFTRVGAVLSTNSQSGSRRPSVSGKKGRRRKTPHTKRS